MAAPLCYGCSSAEALAIGRCQEQQAVQSYDDEQDTDSVPVVAMQGRPADFPSSLKEHYLSQIILMYFHFYGVGSFLLPANSMRMRWSI